MPSFLKRHDNKQSFPVGGKKPSMKDYEAAKAENRSRTAGPKAKVRTLIDGDSQSYYLVELPPIVVDLDGRQVKGRLVISAINMPEAVGNEWKHDEDYIGELLFVPMLESFSSSKQQELFESVGGGDFDDWKKSDYALADLAGYGYGLRIGNDMVAKTEKAVVDKYAAEAPTVDTLIGFHLDKSVNQIGETGWDWLSKWMKE